MFRKFIVPVGICLGILVAWDFTKPRYVPMNDSPRVSATFSQVRNSLQSNSTDIEVEGAGPAYAPNEKYMVRGRATARKSALTSLDLAWASVCPGRENHTKFVQGLSYYFEQRGNQEKSYPERFGKDGADYIKREWSTAEDGRIERLVGERYEGGYLQLADFRKTIAERITPLVKNTPVRGEPCRN